MTFEPLKHSRARARDEEGQAMSDEPSTAQSPCTPTAAQLLTCNGHHGNPIASISQHSSHITSCRSSESSDSSTSETAASDDSCSSNEAILREAGVTFDLASFTSVDGHAPLELVSQCVSCLLNDQHAAASLLCQKVIELEPGNGTVREIYPVLQERLRLDKELPTESSSESSVDSASQSDS